jgi:undecaprenyl-diphosphatase
MLWLQVIVLAIIQGITEFLPISSSGHLVVFPLLWGWPDQGLVMDVAVHVGTLGAVVVYFRRDVRQLFVALGALLKGEKTAQTPLLWGLIMGTIPAVMVGFLLSHFKITDLLRSLSVIGWTMTVYGVILYAIDRWCPFEKKGNPTVMQALGVGIAQALALVPGTSRSGACMTMMRALGFTRTESARFSFLLSIPAITAAASLTFFKAAKAGELGDVLPQAVVGGGVAFAAGLLTIHGLLRWLQKASFAPFVLYRVVLGLFLLVLAYGGY